MQYAQIGEAFQAAYLVSFILGGWIIDKIGVRWGLSLSILWWSLAAISHGWATSVQGLLICRLLLGLGYPGAYLAAAKAAAEWFPPQERGFVTGIYTSGATVGATLAPPLVAWLALSYSWQYAFFVTGSAGVIYAVVWFLVYRKPSEHPLLSAGERAYILSGAGAESEKNLSLRESLPLLARSRYFWAIIVGRMIGDTPWIFYVMWIPKYLSDTQGLDLKAIGYVAWVPFLFADAGAGRRMAFRMVPANPRRHAACSAPQSDAAMRAGLDVHVYDLFPALDRGGGSGDERDDVLHDGLDGQPEHGAGGRISETNGRHSGRAHHRRRSARAIDIYLLHR